MISPTSTRDEKSAYFNYIKKSEKLTVDELLIFEKIIACSTLEPSEVNFINIDSDELLLLIKDSIDKEVLLIIRRLCYDFYKNVIND